MNFKNIAVLTSQKSWFVPYAKEFIKILRKEGYSSRLFYRHEDIGEDFEVVFVLSYFRIIKRRLLRRHKHNLVVHESALPKNRGWAPLFWQILEGKNKTSIVLFEAREGVDTGEIYIKDSLLLEGHELHDEIRKKQAKKMIKLCLKFLRDYTSLRPLRQKGKATYYRKRVPSDSKLDLNKNIRQQFNLIRIVNNKEFPAFFDYKGQRYILKIFKQGKK